MSLKKISEKIEKLENCLVGLKEVLAEESLKRFEAGELPIERTPFTSFQIDVKLRDEIFNLVKHNFQLLKIKKVDGEPKVVYPESFKKAYIAVFESFDSWDAYRKTMDLDVVFSDMMENEDFIDIIKKISKKISIDENEKDLFARFFDIYAV